MGGQPGRICLLLSGLTRPIEVGFTFPAPFLESSEQAGSFWDISWLCLRIMEASKLHLKAKFGHIFKRREQKFLKICQSLRFSQTGSNNSGGVPVGFFWKGFELVFDHLRQLFFGHLSLFICMDGDLRFS